MTERLSAVLDTIGDAAIAVSGGVDSTTLAAFAHRRRPGGSTAFHAVSPAVPPEATARVRALAAAEGWDLRVIDAGEFRDPAYLANPHDRCFHCKSNLYAAIGALTARTLLSGTNVDDLGDVRPGLEAAARRGVLHPYVEADMDKPAVRDLARSLGLCDLAELPAAPCLSSRVETGIPVRAGTLAVVHAVEMAATQALRSLGNDPQTVRCRVRGSGLVLEADADILAGLGREQAEVLSAHLASVARSGPVSLEPYRRGSAFLRLAMAPVRA